MRAYKKGYRLEYRVKKEFEKRGWLVVRSGRSLGVADLVVMNQGVTMLLQLKSTKRDVLYYDGHMHDNYKGFPFFVVANFAKFRKTVVAAPKKKITPSDGIPLKEFLKRADELILLRMER